MKNTKSLWKISDSTINKNWRISNKAVFAFVFYLIIPIISIMMIIFTYPELSDARLIGILYRIVPISIVLILVSQFQVRYEKGDKGRLILNEIYVLMVLFWIFALLGGEPIIHQTWKEYNFSLYIWKYLVIIIAITGVNVVYYALEYKAYSGKDSLENASEIPQGKEESCNDSVKHKSVTIITVEAQ